jgi:formylglycine-generating enzyme required for sulfatase activity
MKNLLMLVLVLAGASVLLAADAGKYSQWNGKETVAEYAKKTGLDATLTLDLGGGVKWEGVLVPAGTFVMGSPAGEAKSPEEAAAEKQHKVTISEPFYIGKYELTQKQFEKIMGVNPTPTKGDELPATNSPFKDVEAFCVKMSKATGRTVLLPTEAQWEYACRAGTTTAYSNGDDVTKLGEVCWYGENSKQKMHPVGKLKPNAWGIFDMHGNAREFVRDIYGEKPQADATDPTGPTEEMKDPKKGVMMGHVVRGGAFTANAVKAGNCRSASRRPTEGLTATGFRVIVLVKN